MCRSRALQNLIRIACRTPSRRWERAGASSYPSAAGKSKGSLFLWRKKARPSSRESSSRTSSPASMKRRGSRPCCSRLRGGSRTSIFARSPKSCGFSCRARAASKSRSSTSRMNRRKTTSCSAWHRIAGSMTMSRKTGPCGGPRSERRCRSSRTNCLPCSKSSRATMC